MIISVIKETKQQEYRVGLTPMHVLDFIKAGHIIQIEDGAGIESGFTNEEYTAAGAIIVDTQVAWNSANLVIKVKEPTPSEYHFFRKGLIIYTYFHLASNKELTLALMEAEVTAIAYETIALPDGFLPLLAPMSEIAGKMAIQIGAHYLEKHQKGRGVLLSGIPGVKRGKVLIIGGGVVGTNAAKIAVGMGAMVTIVDHNVRTLQLLEQQFNGSVSLLLSHEHTIAKEILDADLVVGAVLVTGAVAPKLVSEQMVETMLQGSVIVDVAIDQGGCIETMDHYTTHENPIYIKHQVIHYAVANMPGAVARTATLGLTNVTSHYAQIIANLGVDEAAKNFPEIALGINTKNGVLLCEGVKRAHNL